MQNPHNINCDCEHCKFTNWIVRETMMERDIIIKDALEALRNSRMSLIESVKLAMKILGS